MYPHVSHDQDLSPQGATEFELTYKVWSQLGSVGLLIRIYAKSYQCRAALIASSSSASTVDARGLPTRSSGRLSRCALRLVLPSATKLVSAVRGSKFAEASAPPEKMIWSARAQTSCSARSPEQSLIAFWTNCASVSGLAGSPRGTLISFSKCRPPALTETRAGI